MVGGGAETRHSGRIETGKRLSLIMQVGANRSLKHWSFPCFTACSLPGPRHAMPFRRKSLQTRADELKAALAAGPLASTHRPAVQALKACTAHKNETWRPTSATFCFVRVDTALALQLMVSCIFASSTSIIIYVWVSSYPPHLRARNSQERTPHTHTPSNLIAQHVTEPMALLQCTFKQLCRSQEMRSSTRDVWC